MDSYAELYLRSVLVLESPEMALSMLFLALARLLPIIALSPFFGARLLPHPVKVIFAISLFIIFLPTMLIVTTVPPTFNLQMILLVIKEAFIGFSIGLIMSIPFTIVQSMGMIIDHQRGGASLMVNDPTIQNQSSPLGTIFNFVLIYVFFIIDGPFYFLNAIHHSYELIPPDRFLSATFFSKETYFWETQLKLYNNVIVLAAQLGAPAIIAILMTDMFLGIANRLAQQVQITFLGLPLKSLLALTVLTLGWKLYNKQTIVEVFRWLRILEQSIQSMSPG